MTKRLAPLAAVLLLGLARTAAAAEREEARPRDVQQLQDDLANLDEDLRSLEPGDPQADRFRHRADDIRDEVVYLKVKMRRRQDEGRDGTGVDLQEVDDLRRSIDRLRDDIERAYGRAGADLELREGTELVVRLEEPVSSRTAHQEDRVDATVFRPLRVDGVTAVPAGTRIRGIVRYAEPAQRPSRAGRLDLDFDALFLGPERIELRSRVVAVRDDDEHLETREKAGIGAVLGGVLGSIVGGRRGALVGVLLGGTGAVVGTKGDEVTLPAGTIVTVRLERPLSLPRGR